MRISDWSSDVCSSDLVGVANDWHHAHLAGLARGGAGLVVAEATAVSPEGRITPGCTGLWTDRQAEASSEEHTSELQSLMRNSYAVFCSKKKKSIYPSDIRSSKYFKNETCIRPSAPNIDTITHPIHH